MATETRLIDLDFDVAKIQIEEYECRLTLLQPEQQEDGVLFPAKSFTIYGRERLVKLANALLLANDDFEKRGK